MKRIALFIMVITLGSKLLGFFRDIALSYYFGASDISDAYIISTTIPLVIFAFIGAGVSTGFIPVYSQIINEKGKDVANKFTSNLITILMIFATIIVIIGQIYTTQIVNLFASGFKDEVLNMTIYFTRISIFSVYFTGVVYLFRGYLEINQQYLLPALVGFPMNIAIILSIVIGFKSDLIALPVGIVIATLSQVLLLIPFVYKKGFKYKLKINIKDKYLREILRTSIPLILGVSVVQINTLVDRTIASGLSEGAISSINYASRITEFVQGIFVFSITSIMFPVISKLMANHNIKEYKDRLKESINIINLFVIPISVGTMIFSNPIIRFLFGRGAFDEQAIQMTSDVTFYFAMGMIGFAHQEVFSRAFYALKDTKTPMKNAVITMIINIILVIILSRYMGVSGLALATSASAVIMTILLVNKLRKKLGALGLSSIIITSLKILFASIVMGLISKGLYNIMLNNLSMSFSLLFSVVVGVLVYFIIVYFLRIQDVDLIIGVVKEKLRRGKTNSEV